MAIHKIIITATCGRETSWFNITINSNAEFVIGEGIEVSTNQVTQPTVTTIVRSQMIVFEAGEFPTETELTVFVETQEDILNFSVDSGNQGSLTLKSKVATFTWSVGNINVEANLRLK